jgi:hypothetical protein
MATETTDYQFNTPVVGTEEDNWGTLLNENFQAIENCFNGVTQVAPNVAVGSWKIDDFAVTATAAELNILDGVTATTAELNYVDGVTSAIQTQLDAKAPLASPALTGTPTAPTPATSDNDTSIATTAFTQAAIDADVATHAALRPSSTVFGHAKMYVSDGSLYIETE